MARIDRRAIEGGTSGADFMEAAGTGVSEVLEDLIDGYRGRRIVILCGKGNNGGDGFVVARLAAGSGASVDTFLLGSEGDVRGDARLNLDRARACGLTIQSVTSSEGLEAVRRALTGAHAAVDALLGTGHRQRSAGAEVLELVHDEQGTGHGVSLCHAYSVGMAGELLQRVRSSVRMPSATSAARTPSVGQLGLALWRVMRSTLRVARNSSSIPSSSGNSPDR